MAAGSIVIDLLMRTGSFETDTGRAEKSLNRFKKEAEAAGKVIGVAFTAAAGALVVFAKQAINSIDALNDVADATGASIENISALESVALRTGSNIQTVTGLLTKFNNVLKEGDPDKGPGAVLKSLNLDIEELKRLDPAEALRQTAVALSGFADDGNKARAVQELFGRSVAELAPLLKDLATQSKLVATTTKEEAEEAEKFNKQLFELQTNVALFGRSIVSDLLPGLNELIKRFKEGNAEGEGFIKTLLRQTEIARLIGLGPKSAVPSGPAKSRFSSGIITDENDQSAAELARLARGAPGLPSLSVVEAPKPGPKGPKPADLFGDYLKSLNRQFEATQELTTVETLLRDVQLGRLGNVSAKQLESLKNIASEIDAAKEFVEIEEQFKKLDEEALERKKKLAEEGKAVFDSTRTAGEALANETERLNGLFQKGAIDLDTYNRALSLSREEFQKISEKANETGDELDKFAERAAESIQASLGDELTNILEGDFDNIGKSFTKLLNRMVAEAIAANIAKAIGLGGGSGGGSVLGAIGGLLGAFGGTGATAAAASALPGNSLDNFLSLNGNFAGARAGGGDVMAGRGYLVGEEGPERFVPRTAGTIVPNKSLGGGGQQISVANYFNVPASVDRRTQEQIANMAGMAVARANRRLS